MNLQFREVYSSGFQKDLFERTANTCLYLTHKAFGSCEVIKDKAGHTLVNRVEASVGGIFVWLLTLPLNLVGLAIGTTSLALSSTHLANHDSVGQAIQDERVLSGHEHFMATREDAGAGDGKRRIFRIDVYHETLKACREGYYLDGKPVQLDRDLTERMCRETVGYTSEREHPAPNYTLIPDLLPAGEVYQTRFAVHDMDTFDLMEHLQKEGFNPVGLNLANRHVRGGGVKSGSGAQEESLFRRSNFEEALGPKQRSLYPIPHDGSLIYTPCVQVFRTREEDIFHPAERVSYQYRAPFTADMITCAAFKIKAGQALSDDQAAITREKIRNIYRVALHTGHVDLVLGALGCGAFHNPPEQIAALFADVLQEDEFAGRFRSVNFGIIFSPRMREVFTRVFTDRGFSPS